MGHNVLGSIKEAIYRTTEAPDNDAVLAGITIRSISLWTMPLGSEDPMVVDSILFIYRGYSSMPLS